jgi:DNA-binding NarL/FixJ family response regulator
MLPFRILIADDHSAVRSVLRALIESHADWQVCGEAVNGFDAVAKAEELKPDLLVLDMAMPIMDGIRAAREISKASATLPILMHTMHSSPILNLEAKKAGVSEVVNKGESGDKLITAMENLLNATHGGTVPGADVRAAKLAAESMAPSSEKPEDLSISKPDGTEEPEPN